MKQMNNYVPDCTRHIPEDYIFMLLLLILSIREQNLPTALNLLNLQRDIWDLDFENWVSVWVFSLLNGLALTGLISNEAQHMASDMEKGCKDIRLFCGCC